MSNKNFLVEGMVCVDCPNREAFVRRTDDDIFETVDRLAVIPEQDARDTFGQAVGFNFNPRGLLLDFDLRDRGIIRPNQNYIRDWMHTLVSGGQANVHTALLLHLLKTNRVRPSDLNDFALTFTLPHKYGKVSTEWLNNRRLSSKDHTSFSSYASTMLTLVPIIFAFLVDVVATSGHAADLAEHVRCYGLLASIIGLLQRVDLAVSQVEAFKNLVDEYAVLYIELYGRAKSKFHDLFHLHESIQTFSRVLSCFVTERRHRQTKKAALHVFRFLEQTVLKDMVNRMCEAFSGDSSLFKAVFLLLPKAFVICGCEMHCSHKAVLQCGVTTDKDIVYARTTAGATIVGRVQRFWEYNGSIIVCVLSFSPRGDGGTVWSEQHGVNLFLPASSIVDAVAWRRTVEGDFRIIPPYVV
jgi:hypothetical protein